ncbi:MAG TPA: secretin N-terminal domain-containing protein [Gemmatimonadales bacterium]|nr:secretin N-terminal domain-containing protein [Gemmatimonadales bacterium]
MVRSLLVWAALLTVYPSNRLFGQDTASVRSIHDSVQVRFIDTDLRTVIQALGWHLPKPVIVGPIPDTRVSMETPGPVPPPTLIALLANLVQSQGLEFTEDSVAYRVGVKPSAPTVPQSSGNLPRSDSSVHLFVIRLKHARASDVAATVNQLFGGSGAFAGGGSTNTLSDELRRNQVPVQQSLSPGPGNNLGQPSVGNATFAGSVTIVADELTNALLVRANEHDFTVLSDAVTQLDVRPLQVLIEVTIVEAQHNQSFSLATNFLVPPQPVDHGDGTVNGKTTSGSLGDFAITLLNVGHANISAALSAAASKGEVQILSRPVLLASNNTEAHILVGSQQPFVQVSRSLPTDTPSRDQVVQYEPVGTSLTVRPTINEDGYVSLVIHQEVNSATTETQFDAPIISTREASTQVLVRDGQTIVLGGLTDRQRTSTHEGVPLLSSLPLIGGLFGTVSKTSDANEFFLFLTPRILRTDADADSVTAPRLPAPGVR